MPLIHLNQAVNTLQFQSPQCIDVDSSLSYFVMVLLTLCEDLRPRISIDRIF